MSLSRIAETFSRLAIFRSHKCPSFLNTGHGFLGNKKILIIAPHSDDETIGCYNACRNLSDSLIDIIVLGAHEGDDDLNCIRRSECRQAIGKFVNSIEFMDVPDGNFSKCYDELEDILSAVHAAYDFILSPAPNDITPDHIPVATAAIEIIPDSKLIFYRSTWLTFSPCDASFYFSWISSEKIEALRFFNSQRKIGLASAVLLATDKASGMCYEYFQLASAKKLRTRPKNSISLKSSLVGIGE